MPNFTVSTDVDSFMQGADFAAMRTSLGVKSEADTEAAGNRRAFSGGVVTNLKGTADDMLSQPMPSIGTGDFTLYWEGKKQTQGGNFAKSLFRGLNGISDFSIKIDITSGGSYVSGAVTFDFTTGSKATILCGAGYFDSDATFKFTFDRDGVASVYKNGELGGTVDISGNSNIDLDFTVAEWFNTQHVDWIGRGLAILNTALTSTQAAEIYRDGLQPWLAANPAYRKAEDNIIPSNDALAVGAADGANLNFATTVNSAITAVSGARTGGAGSNIANIAVVSTGAQNASYLIGKTLAAGHSVLVPSIWIKYTGTYTSFNLRLTTISGNVRSNLVDLNFTSAGVWQEFSNLVLTATDSVDRIMITAFGGTAGDSIDIDDFNLGIVGALANLPLDDDSRQLKDVSGNRNDATASEAGVNHLIQQNTHSFRDDHADGTGGSYLIANADILAENEVITGVTMDGRFYAATEAQDLTKRRIKLVTSGSHIEVKRSNGTTDDAANVTTHPASTTDFAVNVLTQRI
jgi:hypothetical protein